MKINAKQLRTMLSLVEKIVGSNNAIPIYNFVHLHADGGKFALRATSGSGDITLTAACEGDMPALCAHYKQLRAALPKEGDVFLEKDGVDCMVGGLRVDGFPSVDFPALNSRKYTASATCDPKKLRIALDYVRPAVSNDETRYHLCAVHFLPDGIYACDGHRVHVVKGVIETEGTLSLPLASAETLSKLLHRAERAEVEYNAPAGAMRWKVERPEGIAAEIVARSNAQPPPFDRVIPKPDRASATVSAKASALSVAFSAIRERSTAAALLAAEKRLAEAKTGRERDDIKREARSEHGAVLSLNGACKVKPSKEFSDDVAEAEVPATLSGDLLIRVNARYAVEALALEGDVSIGGQDDKDPLRFDGKLKCDLTALAVVMPMRM